LVTHVDMEHIYAVSQPLYQSERGLIFRRRIPNMLNSGKIKANAFVCVTNSGNRFQILAACMHPYASSSWTYYAWRIKSNILIFHPQHSRAALSENTATVPPDASRQLKLYPRFRIYPYHSKTNLYQKQLHAELIALMKSKPVMPRRGWILRGVVSWLTLGLFSGL
jgi:hypothetical protein